MTCTFHIQKYIDVNQICQKNVILHKFAVFGVDSTDEMAEQVCGHLARSRTPAESLLVNQVRTT